jgi:hypothetical protein
VGLRVVVDGSCARTSLSVLILPPNFSCCGLQAVGVRVVVDGGVRPVAAPALQDPRHRIRPGRHQAQRVSVKGVVAVVGVLVLLLMTVDMVMMVVMMKLRGLLWEHDHEDQHHDDDNDDGRFGLVPVVCMAAHTLAFIGLLIVMPLYTCEAHSGLDTAILFGCFHFTEGLIFGVFSQVIRGGMLFTQTRTCTHRRDPDRSTT